MLLQVCIQIHFPRHLADGFGQSTVPLVRRSFKRYLELSKFFPQKFNQHECKATPLIVFQGCDRHRAESEQEGPKLLFNIRENLRGPQLVDDAAHGVAQPLAQRLYFEQTVPSSMEGRLVIYVVVFIAVVNCCTAATFPGRGIFVPSESHRLPLGFLIVCSLLLLSPVGACLLVKKKPCRSWCPEGLEHRLPPFIEMTHECLL
mmetsp:Transcript_35168/g.68009  ORF Transcript_35168/g.68009 Transcript_35168/m.68009 type:complete len:203 (+) Transcript_35168:112-720(+)